MVLYKNKKLHWLGYKQQYTNKGIHNITTLDLPNSSNYRNEKDMKYISLTVLFIVISSFRWSDEQESAVLTSYQFKIQSLTDEQYPDDPDIGFRSKHYVNDFLSGGEITVHNDVFTLSFYVHNQDTIQIHPIDFSEFIPTIPDSLKDDEYLSYLACINQEWNRNQVEFGKDLFSSTVENIVRVDVARNCLNAGLWEIIVYTEENKEVLPIAHGWFSFPESLYAALFHKKNNIAYSTYEQSLEDWVTVESKKVDISQLRTVVAPLSINYRDESLSMYPLGGARKKKFKEIIYPQQFSYMKDLQNDSTMFATFSKPGYYNKKDPRKTELGRFFTLKDANLKQIKSNINGDILHEVQLTFNDRLEKRTTVLTIGGLNLNDFPVLSISEANNGWKNSMGFSNHSFYEDYQTHRSIKSRFNPYYAFLSDSNGMWLDSHHIGMDGSIFHFSDKERKNLHIWLLSFERHALVGHYVVHIQ